MSTQPITAIMADSCQSSVQRLLCDPPAYLNGGIPPEDFWADIDDEPTGMESMRILYRTGDAGGPPPPVGAIGPPAPPADHPPTPPYTDPIDDPIPTPDGQPPEAPGGGGIGDNPGTPPEGGKNPGGFGGTVDIGIN